MPALVTAAVCSVPVATPTTDIFRNPSTRFGESRSLDPLDPLDPDPWPSWHISETMAQDGDKVRTLEPLTTQWGLCRGGLTLALAPRMLVIAEDVGKSRP